MQPPTPIAKPRIMAVGRATRRSQLQIVKFPSPFGTAGTFSPIKDTFTKASLAAHLSDRATVDLKAVKAVLSALEDTILGAVHKKGAGEFTLSGLLKISAQVVPAKKRRFGKDPFSGEDRWFDAKPASVRIKARALKKLKDAAA